MDEHAEKNEQLAKALGWRDIEYQETWRDDPEGGFHYYDALRGVSPDGALLWLPDFWGSVDAAWELVADIDGFSLTVSRYPLNGMRFEASIPDPNDDGYIAVEYANTPAEAICQAWLVWAQYRA